jgi:hypothetical protein
MLILLCGKRTKTNTNLRSIAVARPHQFVPVGKKDLLDGGKSMSFPGKIDAYEWIFTNGSVGFGSLQERRYDAPGTYSEVLKVIDSKGNIDYDYVFVQGDRSKRSLSSASDNTCRLLSHDRHQGR